MRKTTKPIRRAIAMVCILAMAVTLMLSSFASAETVAEILSQRNDSDKTPLSSDGIKEAVSERDIYSLLLYYLNKNADYYRENFLNPGFTFFNADKYLRYNADVSAAVNNSREGALEHYLTIGALEGRSPCADFDPVVAIILIPEAGLLTPEEIVTLWKQTMGDDSTREYIISVIPTKATALRYTAIKKRYTVGIAGDSPAPSSTPIPVPAPTSTPAPVPTPTPEKPSFTMLVYLCGTDLESKRGSFDATRTMMKILLGAYDEENVNVMLLAGGTNSWKNTYFNNLLGVNPGEANKSAIFSVNKEGVKAAVDEIIQSIDSVNTVAELNDFINNLDNWNTTYYLIDKIINKNTLTMHGEVGTAKMGEVSTLVSLLEEAKTGEFKADSYGLSLWNHGGGALKGVCFPDDDKTNPLEIYEIRDALKAADYGSTESDSANKLGLLAFDACLMGGAEIAAYLSDYFDIMYGSEEVTYGDIDYFSVINEANQKAGEDYLGYYLAIEIARDRVMNYKGKDNLLSTGALFESGKTANALAELNRVAAQLNELTANGGEDANMIYRAFKNARLRCEQIGSSTTRKNSEDYVDMKDFLQTLKAELDNAKVLDSELSASIDQAVAAADQATFATLFNYAGQMIYLNFQDIEEVWLDKELWSKVKGMELSGASIYVPCYGVDKKSLDADLNYFKAHYADNLSVEDYSTFITNYSNDFLNSDAERERISKLTDALIKGEENGNTVTGYAQMLDMELKETGTEAGDVLSIKIKDYKEGEASQYSSGDAFIDMCETMNTMLVYITRKATAMYAINGEKAADNVIIDVVVGSKTISYENLNGLQSAVNIFTNQFDSINMGIVDSTDYSDFLNSTDLALYDFVVPSDIEGYVQKNDIIKLLHSDGTDGTQYLTVKGEALVDGEYVTAYHLFFKEPYDEKSMYCGSTQLLAGDDGYLVVGDKLDATAITFYHQTINNKTNKLVYAEEYQWASDDDTCNILSLIGRKEYVIDLYHEITIADVPMKSIGAASDNAYYFAVSQKQATTDDDILSDITLPGTTHESSDIFESIESAYNGTAAAQSEPAVTEEAEPVSEEQEAEAAAVENNEIAEESAAVEDIEITITEEVTAEEPEETAEDENTVQNAA